MPLAQVRAIKKPDRHIIGSIMGVELEHTPRDTELSDDKRIFCIKLSQKLQLYFLFIASFQKFRRNNVFPNKRTPQVKNKYDERNSISVLGFVCAIIRDGFN